ncbi:MAG: hypothetical protein V4717_13290 [Bacteroidota bacterium]
MQLGKLALLGNGCFWLTLVFQYWKPARNLQQDLLNTVVIIGLLGIVFNLAFIGSLILKKSISNEPVSNTSRVKEKVKHNQNSRLLFTSFNLFSFAVQLIFLYSKFL